MKQNWLKLLLVGGLGALLVACSGANHSLPGTWKLIPEKSTNIQTWIYRTLELEIRQETSNTIILQKWLEREKVAFVDSVSFAPGKITEIPVTSYIWPENWYMGVLSKKNSVRKVSGAWRGANELTTTVEQLAEVSQGDATLTTVRLFSLNREGDELTVVENRSTRPAPIKLVFARMR